MQNYNREMDDYYMDIALFLLIDSIGENDTRNKRETCEIYKRRTEEGAFNILFNRHLVENDTKFRAYLRLTPHLFHYVLTFIQDDIRGTDCNRHRIQITPEQKLKL